MKKFVLIFCAVGFGFLVIGGVLAAATDPSLSHARTITCHGTIARSEESLSESQSVQASESQLDKLGYVAVLVSFGFFAAAFLHNRKS